MYDPMFTSDDFDRILRDHEPISQDRPLATDGVAFRETHVDTVVRPTRRMYVLVGGVSQGVTPGEKDPDERVLLTLAFQDPGNCIAEVRLTPDDANRLALQLSLNAIHCRHRNLERLVQLAEETAPLGIDP